MRLFPLASDGMHLGIIGALLGLLSFNRWKILLGLLLGGLGWWLVEGVGLAAHSLIRIASLVGVHTLASRALVKTEPVQLMAERVHPEQLPYVVPFEAHSRYIGTGYFETLARDEGGVFKRNPPGIGIVASLDAFQGPEFDPAQVHPLIREFYEHTSRFLLDITPIWNPWYQPLFYLFKRFIAQPIGQANLPFNQQEAQRGVVSYIDTIDFDRADVGTIRGWVRAFEETGEAIYVGVYTTFRHAGVGYVSVGFPLPESNFTATLVPAQFKGDGLLLRTRQAGLPYPGHYLSAREEGNQLTVLKLPTLDEAIEVFVEAGQLRTEHRFYLAGLNFLTLSYQIHRKPETTTAD
jgi:hypothetical protein